MAKKRATIIRFGINKCVKVINGDPHPDDAQFIDNYGNFVVIAKATLQIKRENARRKNPNPGEDSELEVTVSNGSGRAVEYAWCYGPCDPVGMSCPAGQFPVCSQTQVLSCEDPGDREKGKQKTTGEKG